MAAWKIELKFKLLLGNFYTQPGRRPSSISVTKLLTVALGSFLEQIGKEFTFASEIARMIISG